MSVDEIPDDVRRFILLSVPSVPYLEAVLLFRAHPGAALDATAIARGLYLPESTASELLRQLADARVVAPDGSSWRYAPEPELAQMIDSVAAAYTANLVGVAKLIHAKSDRRAAQFAEAFKLRKE